MDCFTDFLHVQEIEEACLNLKFDPQNRETKHRPMFIFEDVNKFDVADMTSRKAVQMLFNAVCPVLKPLMGVFLPDHQAELNIYCSFWCCVP